MVTCIECRADLTHEPKHREGCNIPAIAILKQLTKLEALKPA